MVVTLDECYWWMWNAEYDRSVLPMYTHDMQISGSFPPPGPSSYIEFRNYCCIGPRILRKEFVQYAMQKQFLKVRCFYLPWQG